MRCSAASILEINFLCRSRARSSIALSVSDDGNILYLGFSEPELNDLVLMAYGEGLFLICAKSDIDAEKKGVLLKDFPKDAGNPNLAFIKFTSGDLNQVLKFSTNCPN